MPSDETTEPYTCSPSTTWAWKKVKIGQAPQAQHHVGRRPSLSPWPSRKRLHIEVKYRGGAQAWVELRSRGETWRVTGDTAIYDVLVSIFGHAPR